ncbi:hypothetical protein GCM10007981_02270 [Thermocladium modestius]|uniref:Transposase n=1 Tax=Thermocladium modestius TaxID=62609 RepID=A0A830GTS2_9CREN|nr:hypothetical protein GCM10007981_02270 [Thermocladium modestius]
MEGKVKGVIIKKSSTGWHAIFQTEVEKKPLEKTGRVVGIDLGVEKLVNLGRRGDREPQSFR